MNITNQDYRTIEKALLIIRGEELSPDDKKVYDDALDTMQRLSAKKADINARAYAKIKERRLVDKDYARPKNNNRKHQMAE